MHLNINDITALNNTRKKSTQGDTGDMGSKTPMTEMPQESSAIHGIIGLHSLTGDIGSKQFMTEMPQERRVSFMEMLDCT